MKHPVSIADRRDARNSLPPKIKALVPDPDHDAVHALAGSLAKPVLLRQLPAKLAYATIAVEALKLPDGGQVLAEAWQTLKAHIRWRREMRRSIERRIITAIAPLIAEREPPNVLLSEAHGVNGATGFQLTEEEVTNITAAEVWQSLPEAPRRRRRGP